MSSNIEIVNILRKANLRATLSRVLILQTLYDANTGISANEIENLLNHATHNLWLTSIYTILKSFEKSGLVTRHHRPSDRQAVFILKSRMGVIHSECIDCKKQIPIQQNLMDQFIFSTFHHQHIQAVSYNLVLQVRCHECLNKQKLTTSTDWNTEFTH